MRAELYSSPELCPYVGTEVEHVLGKPAAYDQMFRFCFHIVFFLLFLALEIILFYLQF